MAEESNQKTKKGDFIEFKFTGYVDGKIFDSNIEEDLKKIAPEAKPEKIIAIIGQGTVVQGLDKALENKDLNKEYEVDVSYNEAFGERKKEFVKIIPLKVFTQQKINPRPGASLLLDNQLAKIITISGARVVTDFNNPLAGKDLRYKFKIIRIVSEIAEKTEAFFTLFLRFKPDFEISGDKVIIKGQKFLKEIINLYSSKFKELTKKELEFQEEEVKEKKPGSPDSTKQQP